MEDFVMGRKVVYRSGDTPKTIAVLSACIVTEENELTIVIHGLNGKSRNGHPHLDLMIEDQQFYAGIKSPRNGTAKEFLIAESIENLKNAGYTDSDIYKLVPTW